MSQLANVAGLLPAETDRQQLGVVELEETGRRQWVRRRPEPVEGGLGRSQRHLLLEHDMGQRPETLRPIPQRGRPEPPHYRGQIRIAGRQLADGATERVLVESWRGEGHGRTIAQEPQTAAAARADGRFRGIPAERASQEWGPAAGEPAEADVESDRLGSPIDRHPT